MRVALYGRVSTTDKNQNPENQLLPLRQFCQQQGWVIAGEYVDPKTVYPRQTEQTSDSDAIKRNLPL